MRLRGCPPRVDFIFPENRDKERHLTESSNPAELPLGFEQHRARPSDGHVVVPPSLHVAAEVARTGEAVLDRIRGTECLAKPLGQLQAMHRERLIKPFLEAPRS